VAEVYPLIFEPIFKPKLWGGRKLASLLDKALPPNEPIGESWEIADLEDDQSVVAVGPKKGRPLSLVVAEWGTDLTGRAPLVEGRFPLLLKFLDATDTLSIQVHPTEEVAGRLGGRVRVKHEAWYVVDADTDGFIYRGFKPGVDAEYLRRAMAEEPRHGVVERSCLTDSKPGNRPLPHGRGSELVDALNRIPVRKGHCYYLPSGTVHALGKGVTVAEVQTPSEITYRLYDWDRIDPHTGARRMLHIDEALASILLEPPIAEAERRQHTASVWTAVTSLVRCEAFVIERVRMVEGVEQAIPYAEMVIWMVLEGEGEIIYDGPISPMRFRGGDTVVLPAALKKGRVKTTAECLWLEVTVPVKSSLEGWDRPPREGMGHPPEGETFVPLRVPK